MHMAGSAFIIGQSQSAAASLSARMAFPHVAGSAFIIGQSQFTTDD
jgi:hypothetical protein